MTSPLRTSPRLAEKSPKSSPPSRAIAKTIAKAVEDRVWASAPVLCDWLLTQDLRGERVLELGSGTGACGLFAAARGAEGSR